MKRMVKIDGSLSELKIGQNAIIIVGGQLLRTGAITTYNKSGGQVYIETRNTVYVSYSLWSEGVNYE